MKKTEAAKGGKINVTTENIFPIIKKFLYSDHEIFLRELVSNAIDASEKIKTLASIGEYSGDISKLKVEIKVDKKAKTITVSDQGIGMTEAEVEKYINQIALSGAEDFVEKYKEKANKIIGHFGLGFYSSFMVSDRVDIISKSSKKNTKAIKWSCDGSPNYTIEHAEKKEIGTDIIMHIDSDSEEFLEDNRISELLNKYCKFLPVPIVFGKEKDYKDGKEVATDKDNVINNSNPLWKQTPSKLKTEDYNNFYKEIYPMTEDPLFNIHLNVDYPFNLTGILYFPKIKKNIDLQKNKIQLYANQVFVTDSVEGIVPEFLTLLHGVLDSPDIPLNVSRSYLQSDANVKKISNHITKKVADKLNSIFKEKREEFEKKWDDLKIFIEYGMITEEKFYEKATNFFLFKNTDNKYFTIDEYSKVLETNQIDKDKNKIVLYTTNEDEQFSYIENAKTKGYDVILLDSHLTAHVINHLEQKLKNTRFIRVDSDTVENIFNKEDKNEFTEVQKNNLSPMFSHFLPKEKGNFIVDFKSLPEKENPVVITQEEFLRRMKDMAEVGGGGGFNMYGSLGDSYKLIVNTNNKIVKDLIDKQDKKIGKNLEEINVKIKETNDKIKENEEKKKDKKDDEIPKEVKEIEEKLQKELTNEKNNLQEIVNKNAKENVKLKQIIDIALLSNNMLKGKELADFVNRSYSILK